MIIIVDSGSTKADWCLLSPEFSVEYIQTEGINPIYVNEDSIIGIVKNEILPKIVADVRSIYFFGAGCNLSIKNTLVFRALSRSFPLAEIKVQSDLMAACIALLGNKMGIAGILGTGAGSCFYNGESIVTLLPGLGYAIGDEGSGAYLGKKLIASYQRGLMPAELEIAFTTSYETDNMLSKIYEDPYPSRVLASYTRFLSKHIHHPYVADIIRESLDQFVEIFILHLRHKHDVARIGIVGSIAYHFSDILKEVIKAKGIEEIKIIQSPIEELRTYFINKFSEC